MLDVGTFEKDGRFLAGVDSEVARILRKRLASNSLPEYRKKRLLGVLGLLKTAKDLIEEDGPEGEDAKGLRDLAGQVLSGELVIEEAAQGR